MKIGKIAYLAVIAAVAGLIGYNSNLMTEARAEVTINTPAPDVTFTDINGTEHSIAGFKGKTVVLEWHNPQCPFVKKFYKNSDMPRFQKEATADESVIWISVNSGAEGEQGYFASAEDAQAYLTETGAAPTAYVVDASGEFGRAFGAKTTPHMFVIDPEGMVVYQGAIDNKASADPADISDATNYVMKALHDLKNGYAVADQSTQPYGCSVKYGK